MKTDLKKRTEVGLILFALFIATILPFDGLILRILLLVIYCLLIEEYSSLIKFRGAQSKFDVIANGISTIVISFFVTIMLFSVHTFHLVLFIAAAFGFDVFAYIFGRKIGGKFIKQRPFPTVSPKKSWEGIILGLLFSGALCLLFWIISSYYTVAGLLICIFGGMCACFRRLPRKQVQKISRRQRLWRSVSRRNIDKENMAQSRD